MDSFASKKKRENCVYWFYEKSQNILNGLVEEDRYRGKINCPATRKIYLTTLSERHCRNYCTENT